MPAETQHLEQRVAALQSDLNRKDEQIGALTFSDNDRELSRRDWFDEAQRLQAELHELTGKWERFEEFEHGLQAKLAERDALLERCRLAVLNGEDFDLPASLLDEIKALSASVDLAAQPVPTVPDGYCIMPKRLTAENGAKALLLGEFKLQSTHECPECRELEEPSEGCEICDGEGEYGQKHTIPWDLIKFIYSKAVEGLAVKAEPAKP